MVVESGDAGVPSQVAVQDIATGQFQKRDRWQYYQE
jgi:hypothetical protein